MWWDVRTYSFSFLNCSVPLSTPSRSFYMCSSDQQHCRLNAGVGALVQCLALAVICGILVFVYCIRLNYP